MDNIIDFLTSAYAKYGIFGAVIGTSFLFSSGLIFEFFKGLGARFWTKKKNKIEMNTHIFFDKYDYFIKVRLPSIKIECPLRKALFSRLLILKANSYKDNFENLSTKNIEGLSPDKLCLEITETVGKSSNEWKKKAVDEGIPLIVCEKLSHEMGQIKQFIYKYIESVCHSVTIGSSNQEKLATIMDFIWTMEEYLISELEKILDELNGDVSNIKTAEFKCSKCTQCKANWRKKVNH